MTATPYGLTGDEPLVLIATRPRIGGRPEKRYLAPATEAEAEAFAAALDGWTVTLCDCRDDIPREARVRRMR